MILPVIEWNPLTVRLMNIGLWITFFFVTASMLAFGYLFFLDPVAPKIEVLESRLVDHSGPNTGILDRPGFFEVQRVVRSSATRRGTLYAYFESARADDPLELPSGEVVIPDRTRFEIAHVDVTIQKGIHRRDRYWEVPRLLPPGEYVYRSRVEFCNLLSKCVTVEWPPIPVTLSGHDWPKEGRNDNPGRP